MKNLITLFALVTILLLVSGLIVPEITFSQTAPPPPPIKPQQQPVDGGLALLAAAGGAYAVKKLRDRKE